jgi:hypothetical protein
MNRSITLLILLLAAGPAWPHGDEDHDHAEAPVAAPTLTAAPRASAFSEEFELVAVLADDRLTLYLDHYASNAPVADARIELESGAYKGVARQIEAGTYELPGTAFAKPGKYPLVVSLETADSADLLTATLEVAPPAAATAEPVTDDSIATRLGWAAAGVLLLVGAGMIMLRRRK